MFEFLKNHPFAVEAFFESSIVLTFALPKEDLLSAIPQCLKLDTFDDKWAFLAVAMVQTKGLRPKGFPQILGRIFFLVGYRIFVRYTNRDGKSLRGLYILKSDTDKYTMKYLGNIFTHYNYERIDIKQIDSGTKIVINSGDTQFSVVVEMGNESSLLPMHSPFKDWKEARKFTGPLPHTFSYNTNKKEVLIVEGIRQNWKPYPIKVINYHIPLIQQFESSNINLANAFIVRNVPYHWEKGKLEIWQL